MDGVPPTLWIREKALDILFACIGELYGQRIEDSIRCVSQSRSLHALNCMYSEGDHLSPEDHTVLGLAGIELIFIIVAIMGLCFGFVLETKLITQGCFSYC